MMTKEQHNQQIRAVNLVIDYYKYFLNIDFAKCPVNVIEHIEYDHQKKEWIYKGARISVRKYKSKKRNEEVSRLKNLLTLHPDMQCTPDTTAHLWYKDRYDFYDVIWIDLRLPSIANNTLGLERNNVE